METKVSDDTWMRCGDWIYWDNRAERRSIIVVSTLTTFGIERV